jgi:hypothetical protein
MQDPQTATLFFFGPVAAAYLAACAGWLIYNRLRPAGQAETPLPDSDRPVFDFLLTLAAAAGILLLGAVYRQGWLLPTDSSSLGRLFWSVDNLIIFSPIAAVLIARRQGPETIFLSSLSPARLAEKVALGIGLGVLAVSIYLALRAQIAELPEIVVASVAPDKMSNFLPIFLEGVAVAFGFVRFRWLVGMAAALIVPSVLFAAAHIPGQLAEDRALFHIAAFFVFNTALATAILWTVQRSRDVIWIGMAHYLMDIAIRAI